MRYINTLHEGETSGTCICVKESVQQRQETGNHTII